MKLNMDLKMKTDLKKVVNKVKAAQGRLQTALQDRTWIEDARKFADQQRKDVSDLLSSDIGKVRKFLETERKGLEALQKQIPGEVKKFRKFVDRQKKDLEKLLKTVGKKSKAKGKKKPAKRKASTASSAT